MKKNIFSLLSGIMLLVIVSKGLGFIREALIAARYGASFVSDVYVFEDGMINAIYTVCAGMIATTYIPKALSLKIEKRNYFTSNYMNIMLILIFIIVGVIVIFTKQVLRIFIPGFFNIYSTEIMNNLIFITRINMISLIFVFLENYLIVVLQANNYFIFSSLQGIILNASLIGYLLFLDKYEILGIILAKILAHVINVTMLMLFIRNKKIFGYIPVVNIKSQDIREVFKLGLPVFVVNIISQLNYIVDRSMASSSESGSMAMLSYANTIAALLYSVIGTSLNSLAYTGISEVQNEKKYVKMQFVRYRKILVNFLMPSCIVMGLFSKDIVNIIYGRGQMNLDNISIISVLLILYIPSNFLLCIRDLYNRLLYIDKKVKIPSTINFLGLLLNIIFNVIFTRLWGVYGLALATSLVSVITVTITIVYSKNYDIIPNIKSLTIFAEKTLIVFCLIYIVNKIYLFDIVWLQIIIIMSSYAIAMGLFFLDEFLLRIRKRE